MAIKYLSDQSNNVPGRKMQVDYTSGSAQDWIILDSMQVGDTVTVGLILGEGAEGYVDFTVDSVESVISDDADGIQWTNGAVTASAMTFFPSSTTAVRVVRTSGDIRLLISR